MGDDMRYWISFDLGLEGNYEELYAWLDNHQAQECGENVATLQTDKTRETIAEELSEILGAKARVYIVSRKKGGKFILGHRKRAPWTGYGGAFMETEEEM